MEKGFVTRAREVEALLGDPRTTFLVVTTLETAPAHEAAFLARELVARDYHLGAIVANRVLPSTLTRRGALTSANRLAARVDDDEFMQAVAAELGHGGATVEPKVVRDVLGEIATRFHDVATVAMREAERRAELAELAPCVLDAPTLDSDIFDLSGLLSLVAHLRS
jgi:anion-transporting  ArsA/GET3 family ATPase